MATLKMYYDGRYVGSTDQWSSAKKDITLNSSALGLIKGMIVEVRVGNEGMERIGGIVQAILADNAVIHLDQSLPPAIQP